MDVHAARFRYTMNYWVGSGPLDYAAGALTPYYQRLLGGDAFVNLDLSPAVTGSSESVLAEVFNQIKQPVPAARAYFNQWSFGLFGRDYQGGNRESLDIFGWAPGPRDARHLAVPLQTLPRTPFSVSGISGMHLEGRVWASLHLCGILSLAVAISVIPDKPQPIETLWALHRKLDPSQRSSDVRFTSKSGIAGTPKDFFEAHITPLEIEIYADAGHLTPLGSRQLLAQLITDNEAITVPDRVLGQRVVTFDLFGHRDDDKLWVGERGVAFRDDVEFRAKGTRRRFETVARFQEFATVQAAVLKAYKALLDEALHTAERAAQGGWDLYIAPLEAQGHQALLLGDLLYDFERAINSQTPATTPWQRALYSKLAQSAGVPALREEIKTTAASLRALTKEVRSERLGWLSRLKDLGKLLG